jgi:regulatory protein
MMAKRRFTIPPPTAESLARVALAYLSRFAASENSLRRVLHNRIRRASMRSETFAADTETQHKLFEAIEGIVARHVKSGVVNDEAYAAMKLGSLRRGGRSRRFIEQKLSHNGIKRETINKTFQAGEDDYASDDNQDDGETAELRAAIAFAKRRRLGSFRKPINRQGQGDTDIEDTDSQETLDNIRNQNRKDLATLARAGFSIDIARKALGNG